MITHTQQIVCLIVSRQLIAGLSSTSRQPVADQSQPISNQLAINRPPVADRSSTGRRLLGIVDADQSPIDLQPKKCSFDRTVVALVAAVLSHKAVADRLQYMCDRGLTYIKNNCDHFIVKQRVTRAPSSGKDHTTLLTMLGHLYSFLIISMRPTQFAKKLGEAKY